MNLTYKLESKNEIFIKELEDISDADEIFLSLDTRIDEVLDFLEIVDKKTSIFNEKYLRMSKTLSLTNDELLSTIPTRDLKTSLKNITEKLENSLQDKENKEYLVTYLSIKRFLRSLSAPYVDNQKLLNIIKDIKHPTTVEKIKLFFKHDKGCPIQKTAYSMVGSSTGRLTVSSGPQILTLKSEARNAFKTRFKNGAVIQIDLIAAEPNIALKFCSKDASKDVYDHLSKIILNDAVTRKQAKLITLSSLYGQSSKNLKSQLPDDINPNAVIKKTRDFFEIDHLEKILYTKYRNKNLRNILGRPITLPEGQERLLISYFLQSSAAEMAIMMFSNLMSEIKDDAVALFVIHDALIVDCNEDALARFKDKSNVTLHLGDWTFEAKVTHLTHI